MPQQGRLLTAFFFLNHHQQFKKRTMALIDATAFKTAIAAAAVQLTAAWKDTVNDGVALDIKHPSHPLRRVEDLFNFDPATGVVTSDDNFIDAAYAGMVTQKGNDFEVITDPPTPPAP